MDHYFFGGGGGGMKIFPRQTIFFSIVACANNFFPAASFCTQFFLYTCVQPVVSVGDDDDDYDGGYNNYYIYLYTVKMHQVILPQNSLNLLSMNAMS